MLNITDSEILELCSTKATFIKGKEYYINKRVRMLDFDKRRNKIRAIVAGSENYRIEIELDSRGHFEDATCTCPAYEEYWGYCKHIVAVLSTVVEKSNRGDFNNPDKDSTDILSFFRYKQSDVKIPVEVEVNYEFSPHTINADVSSFLSLRMGEGKLYVVKNMKKFFEAVEKGQQLEFGKEFTFDPRRHSFKEADQPIIDLLKEIYDHESILKEFSYGYSKKSLFNGKNVGLPSSTLKRFFQICQSRLFNAMILGESYRNIGIVNTDIPVVFNFSKSDKELLLEVSHKGKMLPLIDSGEYFFYEDYIYRVSDYQKENFKPFYNALLNKRDKTIRIPREHQESFLSEVFPYIQKLGEVSIDKAVEDSIYKPELRTEIYFDKISDNIVSEVKFVYGELSINPFSPSKNTSVDNGKILLRELENEKEILDIFEQSEFRVKNNQIHLDSDDKIYDFIQNKISILQEKADIYYSDSFKNMKIYDPSSFSVGVRLNNNSDMLEFTFQIDEIEDSELSDIFSSIKEKKKYYKLKNGSFLPLEVRELENIADIVDYLDLSKKDFGKEIIEIPKFRALYLDEQLKDAQLSNISRNLAFKELVQNIREPGDIDYKVPGELKNILRNYQKIGFKWLKTLESYSLGGILADDMGLGKTLQVITFLLSEKQEKGQHPSLIVAPTSLVYNWAAEIEKFAPSLKALVISGNKDERHQTIENIMDYDVVITSYPLIRRDIELYNDIIFRFCIIDEAQHIKNPQSQNARSVKEIRARSYFALTGTPIENSLTELWSIFDFVMPGYLLSYSKFTKKFERPIIKDDDKRVLDVFGKHIRPFILRRIKKDVLKELPDKIVNKLTVDLSPEQKKLYLAYLKEFKGEIESEIKERGFGRSHIKILSALTRLRQICCHPSLFIDNFTGDSGKMLMLEEVINDSLESGHRILLFSQFTSMLKIIKDKLTEQNIEHFYLDGKTETILRGEMVNRFNAGEGKIFLISLKAGGSGLNLTGADVVIHYDPWWNPAVEEQATDRAHRIGQKNIVHVMKLITKGTIEEKIYELQEKKKKIIDSVIHPGETLLSKFTEDEIKNLFEIE